MPRPFTVLSVVGARPNFMKVAPIAAQLQNAPDVFRSVIVHTGQHYDDKLSKVFFDDLGIPPADVNLNVGSGSHAQQTAAIMAAFEPVLLERQADVVLVVGDVNSTIACALVAVKLGVPVAHVEAGLRSFDRTMPEEINRLLTDQISDLPDRSSDSGHPGIENRPIARTCRARACHSPTHISASASCAWRDDSALIGRIRRCSSQSCIRCCL